MGRIAAVLALLLLPSISLGDPKPETSAQRSARLKLEAVQHILRKETGVYASVYKMNPSVEHFLAKFPTMAPKGDFCPFEVETDRNTVMKAVDERDPRFKRVLRDVWPRDVRVPAVAFRSPSRYIDHCMLYSVALVTDQGYALVASWDETPASQFMIPFPQQ